MNVDFPTFEREAEFIQLMRKLWRGERELNHQSTWAAIQPCSSRITLMKIFQCFT